MDAEKAGHGPRMLTMIFLNTPVPFDTYSSLRPDVSTLSADAYPTASPSKSVSRRFLCWHLPRCRSEWPLHPG